MKITAKIEQLMEVKFLRVQAGVRYWEDAQVNGEDDTEDGLNMPCKEGDAWCPIIDLDTGIIINWRMGTTASIHYKVCDDGHYEVLNDKNEIVFTRDGYVPNMMSPKEQGYGDYIIMDIDENGKIAKWNPTLEDFKEDED